jgi:hypothetical protein
MDGFDKYGPASSHSANVSALLTAGEWNSTTGTSLSIAAPLSSLGNSLSLTGGSAATKTLPSNYSRLIGGMRFSAGLGALSGIQFYDGATAQAGITINTAGTIAVRNGIWNSGTVLGTSASSISANTTHYLEWDITFGNSAAYQLWLDGVSILSGTGDTTATANNTASAFAPIALTTATLTIDDLYIFDTSGSTNNAVLLSSPRIETQLPNSDSSVQFSFGAAVLGNSAGRIVGTVSTAANQLRLRAVTPAVSCTLNSIAFLPSGTASATVQLRPVVFSTSSGVPGTLLGSGSTVTGTTANTLKTMPLTSGVSLTAGTQYYIGFMCDIAVTNGLQQLSSTTDDLTATSTFASGAPGTAPAMSAATGTVISGNVTISGANWVSVSPNPTQGLLSYVADATVGHEDLYGFPALVASPSAIYAVAVKANISKSDAGSKTVSVRTSSSGNDSAGSGGTAIAPATTFGWATSLFITDPNTSAAWGLSALNSALAGLKIET